MSLDCSRFSFQPWSDFLGVVMQQGRVQLDSDWNELVAQLTRRIQAGSLDTFGQAVVPRETPNGFAIETKPGSPRELMIGPGRIYVDGLLAENHGQSLENKWDWDTRLAELIGRGAVSFFKQPYLPFNTNDAPATTPAADFNQPKWDDGPHLVYVDVWQREVTALQKPELIEKAVGVDTTGRLQTVWQVKVLENIGETSCDANQEKWTELICPSGARLTTWTRSIQADSNPCLVPPSAGYQGLENQLYRVEVHHAGDVGKATFKWSRNNATVASRVMAIPTLTQIVIESIGRDEALAFHPGDWVEVLDDWGELHSLPGVLRRVRAGGVDFATRTLTLEAALPAGLFPVDIQSNTDAARHTRVRLWDQSGVVRRADGTAFHDLGASGISDGIPIPPAGVELVLENGVVVEFHLDDSGKFKTGDHWTFAARAVDGSIELLDRAPPRGIHHHYARLAVVTFPNNVLDCRTLWPAAVEGASCECTVCVHPDSHNSGAATIQQAIDTIRNRGGGTICLDAGSYRVDAPLRIEGAHSIRIRGQGWGTLLLGGRAGALFVVDGSTGVSLQNLSVFAAATDLAMNAAATRGDIAAVFVRNTVDFSLDRVSVFCIPSDHPASIAVALSGYLIGANIRDCALVASNGVAAVDGQQRYLLTADWHMTGNCLLCRQKGVNLGRQEGVNLEGWSFHYGDLRISDNLFLICSEVGIELTGGALPGSLALVEKNTFNVSGSGIRSGLDGLRVSENEISLLETSTGDLGTSTGDGIAIDGGFDPGRIDHLQIVGNRIQGIGGHGIAIRRPVGHSMIQSNVIKSVGGSGLVIELNGSADYLSIQNNHFIELGRDASVKNGFYAGALLFRVARVDFVENVMDGIGIALTSNRIKLCAGVLAFACEEVRIGGNRLQNIGPKQFAGGIAGIQCLPPFRHVAINDNTVVGAEKGTPNLPWCALEIGTSALQQGPVVVLGDLVFLKDEHLLVHPSGIASFLAKLGSATVHRNRFQANDTRIPLIRIDSLETCLFAENHCELTLSENNSTFVGQIGSNLINVSNNRLIGAKADRVAIQLEPRSSDFVVLGNMSTGQIKIGDEDLPDPWSQLNPIV